MTPDQCHADCPNLPRLKALEEEVAVLRVRLARHATEDRCPGRVPGERCTLPLGHDGPHRWAGD